MDQPWTLKTIFDVMGWPLPKALPHISITSVETSPLECKQGALFIPDSFKLKNRGYENEEDAIKETIAKGASAVLTHLSHFSFHSAVPVIQVKNANNVMAALSLFARKHFKGKVIAITGSVGKTSTKDVIHHMLSHLGTAYKTKENDNSLAGVFQTVINTPSTNDFMVVEIGATRAGHLRHTMFAQPDIGIITNIGISHLAHYQDEAALFQEKLSLLDYLSGLRVGVIHESIFNNANEKGIIASKKLAHLIKVGSTPQNDLFCSHLRFNGAFCEGIMHVLGTPYPFQLHLPSPHFVNHALFGVACAVAMGLDVEKALESFRQINITPRRFERFRISRCSGTIELIDDSYNAAPASVRALLTTFSSRQAKRKLLIWGDMAELGEKAQHHHSDLASSMDCSDLDLLVTIGKLTKIASEVITNIEKIHFSDWESALPIITEFIRAGDLIGVKGSHGMRLDKIADHIKQWGDCIAAGTWRIEEEVL